MSYIRNGVIVCWRYLLLLQAQYTNDADKEGSK
jgi:hypothetical protein